MGSTADALGITIDVKITCETVRGLVINLVIPFSIIYHLRLLRTPPKNFLLSFPVIQAIRMRSEVVQMLRRGDLANCHYPLMAEKEFVDNNTHKPIRMKTFLLITFEWLFPSQA